MRYRMFRYGSGCLWGFDFMILPGLSVYNAFYNVLPVRCPSVLGPFYMWFREV
jgi:hypothetical protein